jgi:hypothetical protein
MSKDTKVKEAEIIEEVKKNGTLEPENKAKEAIDTLRIQLREHLQQAEHHRTMATKAQGALEVLLQLHPEEENSEG